MRTIQAVVFDIGETLVDETEVMGHWADWLGVPRLTFFANIGARIAREQTGFAIFETSTPSSIFVSRSNAVWRLGSITRSANSTSTPTR